MDVVCTVEQTSQNNLPSRLISTGRNSVLELLLHRKAEGFLNYKNPSRRSRRMSRAVSRCEQGDGLHSAQCPAASNLKFVAS